MHIETFPREPHERRSEARVPSSIPVGIDGHRDLRHTALIHNASRGGALLATRHRCYPGQVVALALHLHGPLLGTIVSAKVVRVSARGNDAMWKFDVGVQFEKPLDEAMVTELSRRASHAPS